MFGENRTVDSRKLFNKQAPSTQLKVSTKGLRLFLQLSHSRTAFLFLNLHTKLSEPKVIRPANDTKVHEIIPAIDGEVIHRIVILGHTK